MGLAGWPAILANLSAVAVMAAMFWSLQSAWIDQVKADREAWKSEWEQSHHDSQKLYDAVRDLTRKIEKQ